MIACSVAISLGAAAAIESPDVQCGPEFVPHPDGCADPPKKRKSSRPVHPAEARKAGAEACVGVLVRVSADGRAVVERILKNTNPGWGFEEAARRAVKKWRYKPARLNGEPVEVGYPVFVDFVLGGPSICNTITELEDYP